MSDDGTRNRAAVSPPPPSDEEEKKRRRVLSDEEEKKRRRVLLWFWLAAAILLLILLFVVCSGGGDDEPQAAAPTTTTTPATTRAPAVAPAITPAPTQPPPPAASTRPPAPTTTEPAATTTEPGPIDVGGVWTFIIDVTETGGACAGEENEPVDPDTVTIQQVGAVLTVTGLNGEDPPWGGEIVDHQVTFAGERDEDGGRTIARFILTVDDDATQLTGIEEWTWSGPGGSCPGSLPCSPVEVVEMDTDINDPSFGVAMARRLEEHHRTWSLRNDGIMRT
jgi:hypothetical protein